MGSKGKSTEKLIAVHAEAVKNFDAIQSAVYDERMQCLEDRRFYSISGAQWEGNLSRQFENKPRLEVNKVHLAIIRIINEYRNNRVGVLFVSKDGTSNDSLADVCNGLFRSDEQDSCAEEAYDNAFEEAVGGGFGAFRLRAEYEDEEDEEDDKQRIRFEPIFDADSTVFFDLNAKRQDKSDAKYCFVLSSMTHDAYEDEYGDNPSTWDKEVDQTFFDWTTPDLVYVAEYYVIEQKKEKLHFFRDLLGEEKKLTDQDIDDEALEELKATGWREVRRKNVKVNRVRKYILSGNSILEDCGYIAGKHIPVIPVYGKRWFIDGLERCMGHVRLCKDAQRLKNMQLSKLAEIAALSSIEKPIFLPEQMVGHTQMWEEDNIRNYPFLLVNAIIDEVTGQKVPAGAIAYTKPPQVAPAMAALLQLSEADMKEMLGNQEAGEELQPNMSGRAVELVQQKLDMQTYIYISNFGKAIKRAAQVWLSMAREVLVEEGRKMKIINGHGKPDSVEMLKPIVDEKTNALKYQNDLSKANFDVNVEIGPSSSSKRAAAVKSLTGMMMLTQDPETQQVLGAMAMMNMEGEGIGDVNDFYRKKLIGMGVVKPTQQEAELAIEEAKNAQPDPQSEYLKAAAEEATAQAAKGRAETVLTIAKSEETRARTVKTLAEVEAMPGQPEAKAMASTQPVIG